MSLQFDNMIYVNGNPESIKKFVEFTGWNELEISFQKIIPIPSDEEIKTIIDSYEKKDMDSITGEYPEKDIKDIIDCYKDIDNKESAISEIKDCLIFSRWGCDEPSYDITGFDYCDYLDVCGNVSVNFYTYNGCPDGIAKALREKFPDLEIEWICLDDTGYEVYEDEVSEEIYQYYLREMKNYCDDEEYEEYKEEGCVRIEDLKDNPNSFRI